MLAQIFTLNVIKRLEKFASFSYFWVYVYLSSFSCARIRRVHIIRLVDYCESSSRSFRR